MEAPGNEPTQPEKRVIRPFIPVAVAIVGALMVLALYVCTTGWERMVRLDCMENLRGIGLQCQEYATKHDGHFPATWVELDLDDGEAKWLHCPESHHEIGNLVAGRFVVGLPAVARAVHQRSRRYHSRT